MQLQPPLHRFQNLLLDNSFLRCLPLLHSVSLPVVLLHCYHLHLIPRLPLVTIAIEESPSLQYWDTLGNSDIHHSRSEFCCQDRVCFCDSMVCGYQQDMKGSNLVCSTKTGSNHNTLRSSGKLNFVQTRQYNSHLEKLSLTFWYYFNLFTSSLRCCDEKTGIETNYTSSCLRIV